MTDFESLSLLIPWLALVISMFTLYQQRKLQREANDLQKATAELAKRQLLLIERDEKDRVRAKLSLSISGTSGNHLLHLRNVGIADALNVKIESLGVGAEDKLLIPHQIASLFPIAKLGASEEIKLGAAVYYGSPAAFSLRLHWQDTDGTTQTEEYSVAH